MGLILKFTALEQPNSFILNDCTGKYTSSSPSGWGGLNPRIEDVLQSYFEITPPYLSPGVQPIVVDTFPDFPNSQGYGYEIMPYMVQNAEGKIESGLWKIKWIVKGNSKGQDFTATATFVVVFRNEIACCVDKHKVKLDKNISTDDVQKKIVEMANLMDATDWAICEGLLDAANKNIEYLKLNCDNCC
jgi:hypothetical protein